MFKNSLGWAGAQIIGRGIWGAALRNPTMTGAALGAGYGAISSQTSILGGALTGAGLATMGRYGMGAMRGMSLGGFPGAGARLGRMAAVDLGRSRIMANSGINKIRGLF